MYEYRTLFVKSTILFWGLVGSTPKAINKACNRLDKNGYEVVSLINVTFAMNMFILAVYVLIATVTLGVYQNFPVAIITARRPR